MLFTDNGAGLCGLSKKDLPPVDLRAAGLERAISSLCVSVAELNAKCRRRGRNRAYIGSQTGQTSGAEAAALRLDETQTGPRGLAALAARPTFLPR